MSSLPNASIVALVLGACLLVSSLALISGTAVTVSAERVAPRVTEEVLETRGVVTVPVERVVREGRVDVTVRRRILGIVPYKTHRFDDVVEVGSSAGTTDVRDSRGRRTSSYSTETLVLRTRAGTVWRSASASGVIGNGPAKVTERLRAFIDGAGGARMTLWWVPWLENAVGIPFALVTALVLSGVVRMAIDRVTR